MTANKLIYYILHAYIDMIFIDRDIFTLLLNGFTLLLLLLKN